MMKAEYIDHSGDDLMVVNAARVSFDKASEWETFESSLYDDWDGVKRGRRLSDRDQKLVQYLAKHGHWTPFAHPQITLRITAPIFVARQAFKSKVGFRGNDDFVENEVSRRYVDSDPEFFWPKAWRRRAEDKKQGSSSEAVERGWFYGPIWDMSLEETPGNAYERLISSAKQLYAELIEAGVCPEQARMVLPQSMITQWYWTGSLAAYARFYGLRKDEHAQQEIQDLAALVGAEIQPLFPVSWEALTH